MFKCKGNGCSKSFSTKVGRSLHHNKCEYYEKPVIDKSDYQHICKCGEKFERKKQLKGHQAKCKTHLDFVKSYRDLITYDILNEMYINKQMSALQIANELNYPHTGAGHIIHILRSFGFNTRTLKESANNETTRDLYKKTCLKKYGDENALGKNSPIYEKRNKAVFDKYGVENVFQLNDVKTKSRNTMLKKYGVTSNIHLPNRDNSNGKLSKIHIKVENMLDSLRINYISEDTRNLFRTDDYNPRPDIVIDDLKIVIEINGDYWHGNPKYYKGNDLIAKWRGDTLVKDIWEHDAKRTKQIESFGYKVIILWGEFIKKELTKEKLWNLLKLNQLKN